MGPSAPGSQPGGGSYTPTAAPVGPACQLLRRERRWNFGAFHPEGPRAASLQACLPLSPPQAGLCLGEGKRTYLLPSLCFGKQLVMSSKDSRLWDFTAGLPVHFLAMTLGKPW